MITHALIEIYGRVQNVFFRRSAKREAERLGLSGIIQNRDDGSVYIETEGQEENIKKFIEWCQKGPDSAEVLRVDAEFQNQLKGYETFEII